MSQKTKGKAFDTKLFRRVMTYVKPYMKLFYFTLFLTIFLAGISVIRPKLIGDYMINDYITNKDGHALLIMTLIIIGLLIIESITQFFQMYFANWIGQSVAIDLRAKIFSKITQLRLTYFDNTPIGRLVTRVVSDIETINEIFSQGLITMLADFLKLIVVIIVMIAYDWELALICFIPIPLLIWATNIFKNAIKKSFQTVRNQVSILNSFVQEHITGITIVQAFNREKQEQKKFNQINKEHRDAHIRSIWAFSIFFPLVELFSAASFSLLIWYGTHQILDKEIMLGTIFTYIMYISMIYRPIRQLADRFNVLQMGMVGSERVFKVLDTYEYVRNTDKISKHEFVGGVKFNKVWFAYKEEDYVVKDVSFQVKAGEKLALVGATGAGKTSIINLLGRFYEFQKGEITIDGVSIRDFTKTLLRKNIAIVLQDVFLFSDTVYNNITLNNPSISREKVIEASKAVGAHDFIMKLPDGYEYNVKERGVMLSVGQRQLISFIRAYVYNPKLLILDEATSSIDTESELIIQNAIEKLTENRTSIVIAHRLSTIQKANKILVFEKGEIIEQGNHEELLNQEGHYRKLHDLQFKK